MTGVSLFLLGAVAVTNIGFLAYLLLDRNTKLKSAADKPPEGKAEPPKLPPADEDTSTHTFVGKSKFNIEDELESRIGRMVDEAFDRNLRRIKEDTIGDVRFSDVEFAATEEPHIPGRQPKDARMTSEQADAAFDDVRIEDVEPDTVSPPSATGASMEDIEESISTAINPDSTTEEKVKAAQVLNPLMDTNLMEGLLTYEEIYKGGQNCMTELLRSNISDKPAKKPANAPTVKPKPKSAAKTSNFKIANDIDDFDPADLLK